MNTLLAILLVIQGGVLRQQPASKPAMSVPAQDIDTYEKAGPYERVRSPNGSLPEDQLSRIARTREWLWTHWRERRRALLIETFYSIEGDRSTFYYFVEPDERGRWRIGIKIERLFYNWKFKDPDCKRFKIETFASYTLTRVDPEPDENGAHRPIPSDAKRTPENYQIQLKLEEAEDFIYY